MFMKSLSNIAVVFGQGIIGVGQHSSFFLSDFSFSLTWYWARGLKPLQEVMGSLGTANF